MEKKYIHYCWFGDKPLPKLAKKCIKSWKKYLPDYEIIRWSEENVNLEECPFIKEAYENKKWAFVADYARTKAIYEYGGIYFDTDMEVVKNIDELLVKKYKTQYENIEFINKNPFHDRYIILDRNIVYSSGMSLKDLGKSYSYINREHEEIFVQELLKRINAML